MSSLLVLVIISFLTLVLKWAFSLLSSSSNSKLPPGPRRLPVIGNIHQLASPLPHQRLAELAKIYGPIMHLKLGEVPTVIVSSPEIAEHCLKTQGANFSGRPFSLMADIAFYGCKGLAFAPYGTYWQQMRKISTMELLSAKRAHSFKNIRKGEIAKFLETISEAARRSSLVDIGEEILSLTFGITSRAAFGGKCKEKGAFIEAVKKLETLAGGFSFAEMYPSRKWIHLLDPIRYELLKISQVTDSILESIVNSHKEDRISDPEKEEDLLDVLLKLQSRQDLQFPMADENIKAVILDIFGGGSETSSTALEWAMAELMKNPLAMSKAQSEVRRVFDTKGEIEEEDLEKLQYLKCVIKETLRLHPSGPLLVPRESREHCRVYGYDIPAKSKLIVNAWAIGRDPKYWGPDVGEFIPERFYNNPIDFKGTNFEYIPFGAGRRMCPGISFAVLNMELPLAYMLFYFDWKLPQGMTLKDLDMEESFGLTVKRRASLNLMPLLYRA